MLKKSSNITIKLKNEPYSDVDDLMLHVYKATGDRKKSSRALIRLAAAHHGKPLINKTVRAAPVGIPIAIGIIKTTIKRRQNKQPIILYFYECTSTNQSVYYQPA